MKERWTIEESLSYYIQSGLTDEPYQKIRNSFLQSDILEKKIKKAKLPLVKVSGDSKIS